MDVESVGKKEPVRSRMKPVAQVSIMRLNRKGNPMKLTREKYLRKDINCGAYGCDICPTSQRSQYKLDWKPLIYSSKFDYQHYLLPDLDILLRQVDVLEELKNVIFLQTVMEELAHKNFTLYKRIREGIRSKKWLYFLNVFHIDTFTKRVRSDNTERKLRIRELLKAYIYFKNHFSHLGTEVVILTDDPKFNEISKEMHPNEEIIATTTEDYVLSITDSSYSLLEEKLCRSPFEDEDTGSNFKQQKMFYPPHIALKEAQQGIKDRKFFQGPYRAFNFMEGCVKIDTGESVNPLLKRTPGTIDPNEILLQGHQNVNRAIDGDIVAIEILSEKDWSVPSGMIIEDPLVQEPEFTADEVIKDEDSEEVVEDLEDVPVVEESAEEKVLNSIAKASEKEPEKRKTGRLVGIIRRKWKPCAGIIKKSAKDGSRFHLFTPDNKKIPKIKLETRNVDRFTAVKVVVQIDQWPISSRYPLGHVIKVLGPVGSVETETKAILEDHGIPHDPFSAAVEQCLPSSDYTVPESEIKKRKDFRDYTILSVDPPGCTDIDDALHCSINADGSFEVGVHIADVSHFIETGTAIDAEASRRSTTVYLADRRIDMIPPLLSSNICSLHPKVDKLTFSVIWRLSPEAEIIDTKYCKSVINSKGAMTYAEAQAKLNSTDSSDVITVSLKRLSCLAQILKKKRFENGALMLSATEVSEDGEVEDECEESHSMVEEFMLLANCSVAAFILDHFNEYAMLRRHPIPPPANFAPLLLAAKAHNIEIIVDQGSKALNDSIEKQQIEIRCILRVLATRCMTQALYCCSGTTPPDEYLHFGLAVRLYTHFTSPIRRYADLMVHRLLAIAIGVDQPDQLVLNSRRMHEISENINIRHRMAQYASRASYNIFKSKSLKGKKEKHLGFVMFVRRNALQVYVPKYAMEGFVFFPESGGFVCNEKEGTVSFGDTTFHPLDKVTIGLTLEDERDKVVFRLVHPKVEGLSVSDFDVTVEPMEE